MARAHATPPTSGCIAEALFKHLAMPVALKAGQSLFRPGDPADGCYWVQSGVLIVSIVGQGGSDRVVGLAGRGRLVGTLALIDEAPRRPA